MLQFIFGRALSGKTTYILNSAKQCVSENKSVVIIVPEQSSFDTEKRVLRLLGDKNMSKINVTSFNRLCDEVELITGGLCGKQITDSGKLIIMNRALANCAAELTVWKKYVNYSGFISSMLDSIEEFKLNYIFPEDLIDAESKVDSAALRSKLHDMIIIYKHYIALLNDNFIDTTDKLTKLYDKLLDCRFFENKTVFLDSFKSFTGQQYKVIERIVSQAQDVYFAFTNDSENEKRYDIFENVRNTVNRIKRIAKSYSVTINENICLKEQFYKDTALKSVEHVIFNGDNPYGDDGKGLNICRAATNFDEAEYVARTIRKLVREENYRYRDFIIIARDMAPYEEAIINACQKNEVACFIDRRRPLAEYPTAISILSAFNVVLNFSTENILRFCKCGLDIFTTEEMSKLENYVNIWNINGNQWLKEWTMNPNGFNTESSDSEAEELEIINALRRRVINPLMQFKNNFNGDAKQRAMAVYELLKIFNATQAFMQLSEIYSSLGELAQVDALRQSWDMLAKVFEDLSDCFGNTNPEDKSYCDAFANTIQNTTVGIAPQMLDEVSFGSADRIRPHAPKVAFILGANQGVFPAFAGSNGLLGVSDREKLIAAGLEIPDKSISAAIDEQFLVYTNLTCATEKLYICFSTSGTAGEELEPSAFVSQIASLVPNMRFNEPDNLTDENLPQTVAAAFSDGCARFANDKNSALNIFSSFEDEEYIKRINNVIESRNVKFNNISPENAKRLYGNSIPLSATKLDTFHRCKFQFFCKYGMKTKKIQPADFDVLQRGTIIHYVLQKIVEDNMDCFAQFSDEEISAQVDNYIQEYLSLVSGYRSVETSRMKFLVANMARSIKEVALQIRDDFAQSEFKPVHCEFKFGIENKPPVDVDFEGGKLLLNGSIDRVDEWNGYIRIVDYKSGTRMFKLPDILIGQNMQMLLYLYAIKKHEQYSNDKAAGIFYMPSKRDRDGDGLSMNGLMPNNEDLMKAMDREISGKYIMKYALNKEGQIYKNYASSFVNEEDFDYIFDYIEKKLQETGKKIVDGCIEVDPIDGLDSAACKYCDFSAICGMEDEKIQKVENITNEQVMDIIKKAVSENGV